MSIDLSDFEPVKISAEDVEVIRETVQRVLGEKTPVRVGDDEDSVTISETVVLTTGEGTVITPSIVGDRKHTEKVWVVEGLEYLPATYWEPEDVSEFQISEHTRLDDALASAVGTISSLDARNVAEAILMERAYRQDVEENCPF